MTNAQKALQLHEEWNGKFETTPKMKIATREDLSLAYTPGVAEPCKIIAKDKEAAYKYTIVIQIIVVFRYPNQLTAIAFIYYLVNSIFTFGFKESVSYSDTQSFF